MRRRASSLACLTLTAALAGVPAAAAPCGRAAAIRLGRWFTTTPRFPPLPAVRETLRGGNENIRAAAIDPADPRVLFVTNGAAMLRSADGGCSWRSVYALPPASAASATPDGDLGDITSIDVTRVAGRSRVLLTVTAIRDNGVSPRTVVLRSDDGIGGWSAGETASLPSGRAHRGGSPPIVHSAGAVAYVAATMPNGGIGYWRSTDHGRTWVLRSSLADPMTPAWITGFAVNPSNPLEVWEWGSRFSITDERLPGLRVSGDGGATWLAVEPWPDYEVKPPFQAADVAWPRRGGPARLLLLGELTNGGTSEPVPVIGWSGDGGRTFSTILPPRHFRTIGAVPSSLPNGDLVLVTSERWAFRIPYRGRPPRTSDWRELARPPDRVSALGVGYNAARTGTTVPTTVVVPTPATVQLLTVSK